MLSRETEEMKESDLVLSAPDEYLRRMFKELYPDKTEQDADIFVKYIQKHPR